MRTAVRIVTSLLCLVALGCGDSTDAALPHSQDPAPDTQVVEHLAAQLEVRVAGGFEHYEFILESIPEAVRDELGRSDRNLERLLATRTRGAIAQTQITAAARTERTTNDAIDAAFANLEANGIIALQNAGYTMSDGWTEVADAHDQRRGARGAVFYHGQDLAQAVAGQGLHLAFGSLSEGADERARSAEIAREVCAVLARHGVTTRWNGSVDERIQIPAFEWRRRLQPR